MVIALRPFGSPTEGKHSIWDMATSHLWSYPKTPQPYRETEKMTATTMQAQEYPRPFYAHVGQCLLNH